jgi:predicted porin
VNTFRQAGLSSFTEVAGNNDVQRITYFTPSFNGLTVGVSYAAGNFTNAANNYAPDRDAGGAVSDIFDIGVNYTQSFGGVDVTLAGRWGTGDRNGTAATTVFSLDPATVSIDSDTVSVSIDPTAVPATSGGDPTTWGIGGRLGTNGFVLGASYTENDSDIAGGVGDQKGWSLGATYDIAGPWSVEALTYQGEVDNGSGVSDSDYEAYRVGAARDLGPGVKWEIFYIHSDTKNGVNGNKIEGDMIGTGLSLSF